MDKLNVLEETQISPPPGSVPATSLPCTYFDLLSLDRYPVQSLFFYQSTQPKTILPNLKHTLSLTLKHYYPLAGNLKWSPESTRPELVYKDGDSVTLTVAESELDFDVLSDSRAQEMNVFAPLYARLNDVITCSSEKLIPLTAFQITFFGERGICIGITVSHIVADAKTIYSFIKAWAFFYTTSASSIKDFSLPSLYDRSIILKGLEKNETALLNVLKESKVSNDNFHTIIKSENMVQMGAVQAPFTMSRDRIQRIKHWVSASIRNEPPPHLSSFSVTCAYTWVCFIKARWGQRGDESSPHDATEHLMVPVDLRARLDSPVPVTYFGNCGACFEVKARRSELLGEEGIVTAAKLIGKGIQSLNVYAELEKYTSYYSSLPPEQILAIGSFPKYGAYETDFGWGKPKRVRTSTFDDGIVCMFLSDCPNEEGGIEIGFVGNPIEVEAFASAFANSLGSHGIRSMI